MGEIFGVLDINVLGSSELVMSRLVHFYLSSPARHSRLRQAIKDPEYRTAATNILYINIVAGNICMYMWFGSIHMKELMLINNIFN